jgi:hypothetical protein
MKSLLQKKIQTNLMKMKRKRKQWTMIKNVGLLGLIYFLFFCQKLKKTIGKFKTKQITNKSNWVLTTLVNFFTTKKTKNEVYDAWQKIQIKQEVAFLVIPNFFFMFFVCF